MRVRREPSFERDLRRLRDAEVRRLLERKLAELVAASRISEVGEVRSVRGARRYYRIRIGEHYRLGVFAEGDVVTLLRFRHRREIYRVIP